MCRRYQTYPHIDLYETGERAAKVIVQMVRGQVNPVMVWGRRPMLPHVMRQASLDFPNSVIQQRCKDMESAQALIASTFVGFPTPIFQSPG